MSQEVDLYNHAYGDRNADTYRLVRLETYGEDFGQTSWVNTEESRQIPKQLDLTSNSVVLEIGCGSGEYAIYLAEKVGCRIVGLDINESGIRKANHLAEARGLASKARFEQCDVSRKLPFDDEAFHAAFSNDALCHVRGRPEVLAEMFRVLKPGGRMLFSDALVVGGLLTNEEIATRSSIGLYFYSPPGLNERLIERAGLCQIRATDTTESAAQIAKKWHDAREKRNEQLMLVEGETNFDGLQRFLSCVHTLTSERRLLRYVYTAQKES